MLKYWRIILLMIMILGAVLAIGFKIYPYGRYGVEVVYVSEDSPAKGFLEQGMLITNLNGVQVNDVEDWNARTESLSGHMEITANGQSYSFNVNDTLGIQVMDMERTNLEFGLDLRGGTRILLKPKENATREVVQQAISTLRTRANIYGLKEMKLYPVGGGDEWYIQIEAAGIGSDIVNDLLSRQGVFEGKITKPVELSGNSGTMQLGDKSWPVTAANDSVMIDGKTLFPNDTITLKGIELQFLNRTEDRAVFLGKVYEGKDIELVYMDPQHSGMIPLAGGAYRFYFSVLVSDTGARRFADVTTGIPKFLDIQSGDEYLESEILLYLDGQIVSDLRIAADLGGNYVSTPSIQGSRGDKESAIEEKMSLQTILRSGALPTTLETVSIGIISPKLGSGFIQDMLIAALLAGIVVVIIIVVRYRSLKVGLPMLLVGMSEVVIIMGIAATNDVAIWAIVLVANLAVVAAAWWKKHEIDLSAWVGAMLIPLIGMMMGVGSFLWTIDLPTIGGLIAVIGTSVDHQIIIADEALKGEKERKSYTMKEKIKRAFFIIMGAALTTIFAMFPLLFLGVGLVRGFAITTIIGVLVGILVTRPAYARIIEAFFRK